MYVFLYPPPRAGEAQSAEGGEEPSPGAPRYRGLRWRPQGPADDGCWDHREHPPHPHFDLLSEFVGCRYVMM